MAVTMATSWFEVEHPQGGPCVCETLDAAMKEARSYAEQTGRRCEIKQVTVIATVEPELAVNADQKGTASSTKSRDAVGAAKRGADQRNTGTVRSVKNSPAPHGKASGHKASRTGSQRSGPGQSSKRVRG